MKIRFIHSNFNSFSSKLDLIKYYLLKLKLTKREDLNSGYIKINKIVKYQFLKE